MAHLARAIVKILVKFQFDFQKNGIEVMNFETLQRTYKENDIYNNPVQGIYHYQVIRRMMDICEKYNLDYERWRKSSRPRTGTRRSRE